MPSVEHAPSGVHRQPCTYRACLKPPIVRLAQSIGGAPWFGCAEHAPAMDAALHWGLSGSTSGSSYVEHTPL